MTSTLDDNLRYYSDVAFYLLYLLCDISFTVSKFHSLGKVFCYNFFVTTRKVNFWRSCSAKDKAGMAHHKIDY
jgi:hypothetical protein